MIDIDLLIRNSMKSKNREELRAYKNLKAEIQLLKTAKNAKPYDEVSEVQLISKMCKRLEEDIKGFSEAHREDLESECRNELEVLKKLLPEPVNESEIYSFIEDDEEYFEKYWITDFIDDGETTYMKIQIPKKEMGNTIKYLKFKFPQADGKLISNIVKKYVV